MPHGLLGLVLAAALHQPPAEPLLSALSPRELSWYADVVVTAGPPDPKRVGRLQVRQVLAGRLQAGQEIQVEGLAPYFPAEGDFPPGQVLEMCLFLTAAPDMPPGQAYRLVPTGLACLNRVGGIYRPVRSAQPGEFHLRPRGKTEDWAALLAGVQADLREVQRLHRARNLPVTRGRNQALLDWIERHRREFQTEPGSGRASPAAHPVLPARIPGEAEAQRERSWGELERLPFLWVLETGILPDCWRAIELYAEIHSGARLGLDRTTFHSREGRAFLAQAAGEARLLAGSRRRALRLLASARTLRGQSGLDGTEQTTLLERLGPLLGETEAQLRGQAARTILEISRPLEGQGEPSRKLVAELVKAYQAEKPGEPREALAEAVRVLGGDKEWQTLTGQPQGLAGVIQTPGTRGDQIHFWLLLHGREVQVSEVPTLVLERLDAMSKVLETKKEPLPLGPVVWNGLMPLLLGFGVQPLEPGQWRMRVEGVSGKERHRWQSEPRLFKVVAQERSDGLKSVDPSVKVKRTAEVPAE